MARFLLACLLAIYFIPSNAAQDDPWLVLQKAAQAARELSYKGVFVYQAGGNVKAVQITHMNFGQGEYARMVVLDGSPREVLRQGNDVVIFNPKNEKVVIEKRTGQNMFPALLPSNLENIKLSYQVRTLGTERVAGRDGQIVLLEPKDKYRYAYKFWADKEYGLLLKAMSTNERNEVMEQITFSQLNLMETHDMDWFHPQVDHAKPYVMEQEATPVSAGDAMSLAQQSLAMDQLPLGYKNIDKVVRMVPGKQFPVMQLVYSDGLASVSLFIEPLAKGVPAKMGHSVMGPTNFFATVIDGHQVIAVGEVPEATVTQFAGAVSFKK